MGQSLSDVAHDSIRGGTFLVIGVGLATIISGIGSIVTANLLGPDDYAVYSLVMVLPTLLASFTIFGIDVALVRYIPKMRAEGSQGDAFSILKTGLGLRIMVAILLATGGYLGSSLFCDLILERPELTPYVQFTCLSIVFEALFWISFYVFQALDKTAWGAMTRTLQAGSKATVSIGLIVIGFGMFGAVIGFVTSFVITATIAIPFILREVYEHRNLPSSDLSNSQRSSLILRYGMPLYAVTVIAAIVIQYRLVLLGLYTSDTVVGNYKAAVNVSTLLSGLTYALLVALLPAFSKISANSSHADNRTSFILAQRHVAMLVVPASTLIIVLSDEISSVIYATEYEFVSLYLMLYSLVFLLVGLGNGVLESFFNGVGENKLTLLLWLSELVLIVPLGFLFTIQYGAVGLIIAFIFSKAFACVIGLWSGKRSLGIGIDVGGLARIYLSAGIATVGLFVFIQLLSYSPLVMLIVGACIFMATYLTFLPLTNGIKKSDLDLLYGALKPVRGVYFIAKPILWYLSFISSFRAKNNNS